MKHSLIVIMAFLCFNCYAQKEEGLVKKDGAYQIESIVSDSSYKKETLFKNSKIYFVDAYKSANDVIQYSDKEEGKIIGKGFFKVENVKDAFLGWYQVYWDVYYSTEIICKDGKYKYRMYGISITQTGKGNSTYIPNANLSMDEIYSEIKKNSKLGKLYAKLNADMISQFSANSDMIKLYLGKRESKKDDF